MVGETQERDKKGKGEEKKRNKREHDGKRYGNQIGGEKN